MRIGGLLLCVGLCLCLPSALPADDAADDPLVQMVVELLSDADKDMRALGLDQVRTESKGEAATKLFAAQLPKLPADGQVGLIRALSDRGDGAARPALLELMKPDSDEAIRIAVIDALGFLGQPEDLSLLLGLLTDGSDAEKAAATVAISRLPGETVSKSFVDALQTLSSADQVTLIEVLAERRAFDTIPDLLNLAIGKDAAVRAAAMATLGKLAGPEDVAGMLKGVLAAERGREREAAEKCVMFVCQRIEESEQQADPVLKAMSSMSESDQQVLLSTLGRIGGTEARKAVEQALSDSDRAQHAAGVRALCNWPNASVASRLAQLACIDAHPDHQLSALRSLIRVIPLSDGRPDIQKLEWLQNALALCTRDDERLLILQRASNVRIVETLRFLLPYLDQPVFAERACLSIVELAHHRELRDSNKEEFHAALDRVMATSQDAVVVDRANRYKKGETWTEGAK